MLYAQGLVRSEAVLSAAVLLAAPLFLRSWAKMEAEYHDTLECRTVLQTYLIAAGGSLCSVFAAIAGNPVVAVLLQVTWRGAAARSLWTWSDLGRNLRETPGWLHASVARWRMAATGLALFGVAARVMLLLAAGGGFQAVTLALSSPAVDFAPGWLVSAASRPDHQFHVNASQLSLGVGLYVWVAYYMCVFLPYRVLYEEYQDFGRRSAQFWKDLANGQEHNVILSTKLGPGFPKHLSKRIARMPPGDDRDALRLAGVVRQLSCSHTVVKASMLKKNKQGKYGVKMTPIEAGDLSYWGSDLFERFDQQERRDKATGWQPPKAPGSGRFKYERAVYARILREVKVELGKTDEEMETDPTLSLENLMRFDPDAEDGEFDLVMQKKPARIDAGAENMRMKAGRHEMVMITDSKKRAQDTGVPLDVGKWGSRDILSEGDGWNDEGRLTEEDSFSYNRNTSAGQALEASIPSRAPSELSPLADDNNQSGTNITKAEQ